MRSCALILFFGILCTQVYASSYKHTVAQSTATNYAQATELLIRDIRTIPSQDEWLMILIQQPDKYTGWNGPYLKQAYPDSWGNDFQIMVADGQFFGVYSFGKNGLDEKGVGDDVTSWGGFDKDIYHPNWLRNTLIGFLLLSSITLITAKLCYRYLSKRNR